MPKEKEAIEMRITHKKNQRSKFYEFTVLFEPAAEGGYVVTCPALPGLITEGDTLRQAREMAKDAIQAYLESLQKDGLPIPGNRKIRLRPVKETIKVALKSA